ncbi:GntR family transcriptional regulator [soil metagenome]
MTNHNVSTIGDSGDSSDSSPTATVDELYHALRDEILAGALAPGAILSQVRLAGRLGVNRTPLREALRMLQQERLVEAEHNKRVRIMPLTDTDLVDLYALRIINSALALRVSLPRFTKTDIDALEEMIEALDRFAAFEILDQWALKYLQIHALLAVHADDRLRSDVKNLAEYCERYHRPLLQQSPINFILGAREHRALLQAIKDRDANGAVGALTRHLARSALDIVSMRNPAFDPVAVREALRMATGDSTPGTSSD